MVEIKSLSFSYGKAPVLNGISTEFKKGKLYGVIGPNGCGKSTLLKLISGILRADSGNIILENKDITSLSRNTLSKKIGLMPQIRPTPDMQVFDYVMCGRFPYRADKTNTPEKDKRITEEALKLTNTESYAARRINELSGGERQRVYLALLLAQNTDLILCDEPTTHLDIKGNLWVMNILSRMKEQGKCVVAVLHDLSSALRLCDELILMDEGRIIDKGTPKELISTKSIDKVFGVQVTPIQTPKGINYIFE